MESQREQLSRLPPSQGRKVLRPGVRIVAEQFAPYDESPDELTFEEYLDLLNAAMRKNFILPMLQMGRAMGKTFAGVHGHAIIVDELKTAALKLEEAALKQQMFGTHIHGVLLEHQTDASQNGIYTYSFSGWSRPATGTVSDKTLKRRAKQPEPAPFYIEQEKKRHRRRR
jgi:hypothetical protein